MGRTRRTDEEAGVELPGDRSIRPDDPAGAVDPGRLDRALERLVERGVLSSAQAGAVMQECGGRAVPPRTDGLRRQLGEIAGYLGASFVAAAALLFLGEQWAALGRTGRVAILAVMAAVLVGGGVAVRRRPWAGDSVRRRLSSTLLSGAGIAAGAAVHAGTSPRDSAPLVASAAGLAVVIAGYQLARSALGQLAAAVGAYATVGSLLTVLDLDDVAVLGAGLLALSVGWVWLGWRRLVGERRFASAIAVTFGLAGAQLVVVGDTGEP